MKHWWPCERCGEPCSNADPCLCCRRVDNTTDANDATVEQLRRERDEARQLLKETHAALSEANRDRAKSLEDFVRVNREAADLKAQLEVLDHECARQLETDKWKERAKQAEARLEKAEADLRYYSDTLVDTTRLKQTEARASEAEAQAAVMRAALEALHIPPGTDEVFFWEQPTMPPGVRVAGSGIYARRHSRDDDADGFLRLIVPLPDSAGATILEAFRAIRKQVRHERGCTSKMFFDGDECSCGAKEALALADKALPEGKEGGA